VTDRDILRQVVALGGHPRDYTARACMSEPAVTVRVDAPFGEVVVTMEAHQLRQVPVVDDDGRCVGIISQADAARAERDAGDAVQEVSRHASRKS
jgi:CBS domain-containing protein